MFARDATGVDPGIVENQIHGAAPSFHEAFKKRAKQLARHFPSKSAKRRSARTGFFGFA
jgi:hypothetical protein